MGITNKDRGTHVISGLVLTEASTTSTPAYAKLLAISTGGKLIYSTTAAWNIVSTS